MAVVAKHHELHNELASIVGNKFVSDDRGLLLAYTRDISTFPRGRPQGVVVRPGSVDEVVELVRLANETRTPLIPIGGKATLSGPAPGQPGRGIIVDMKRMDKVIDFDEENMAVTTQCGISLGEFDARCNERGFGVHTAYQPYYPATVGGQLSGVTGGGYGEYGFSIGYNWHYILGMKVVLPTGSVVDTGTGEGSQSGYRGHTWARGMSGPDIAGMFIGDGGMFGIKVEATYRMFHLPKFKKAGARCFDTLEEAYEAYEELWDIDPFLYMQPYARGNIFAPETISFATMGAVKPAWALVYQVIGNTQAEVDLKHKTTDEILARKGGRVGEEALIDFGTTNVDLMRNMGRSSSAGQFCSFELVVSRRDAFEAYKWSRDFMIDGFKRKGIAEGRYINLGGCIIASGTGMAMTSLIPCIDPSDLELERVTNELLSEFLTESARRGYILAGASGHEARLKARYEWTPEFSNYLLTLKKALDPNNIMNPGVYFP